jgi:hypothetical protein
MNKLFFPVLALLLATMAGCSEKFNVAAPYKNITVIYGFLQASDTAHYIRVQKAFLDQDKSAFTMAKEPDSNFYSQISVKVKRYRAQATPFLLGTIQLERVNLDLEGYPKQPGIFFQSPNYAYKFTDILDPASFYRIVVTNLVTGEVDSSDAPVISNANISVDKLDISKVNVQGLSFYSVQQTKVLELEGSYLPPNPSTYYFNGATNPVGVAQAIIRFNWVDSNISDGLKSYHYYDYDAGYITTNKGNFKYQISNLSIFNGLRNGMGPAPTNTIRLLDRCDLIFYLSTSDFYNYYQISQIQGTGITGSEIQPVYTNVKGANALGLYTAKAEKSGKIIIDDKTVDSLKASPLLSGTNIRGTVY